MLSGSIHLFFPLMAFQRERYFLEGRPIRLVVWSYAGLGRCIICICFYLLFLVFSLVVKFKQSHQFKVAGFCCSLV